MFMDVSSVIKALTNLGNGKPSDVVGFDFGSTGVRAVRLARSKEGFSIVQVWSVQAPVPEPFVFPRELRARAAALAISHPEAVAKLLSIPRPANKLDDVPFAELLGISDPQTFRLAMEIQDSSAAETRVLLAAIPETVAVALLRPFAQGFPAPRSMEVSGLAALNGVLLGTPGLSEQSAMLLDLGAEVATVAITVPRRLAFVRQFRIGANAILRKLGESLNMDPNTARDVAGDGMIDAAEQVRSAFDPLVRQIILGRDFVSRRHNTRTDRLYVAGGLFQAPYWTQPFQTGLGVEVVIWNPLASLPAASGALAPETVAQGSRFAAAAGVAMAALEGARP